MDILGRLTPDTQKIIIAGINKLPDSAERLGRLAKELVFDLNRYGSTQYLQEQIYQLANCNKQLSIVFEKSLREFQAKHSLQQLKVPKSVNYQIRYHS